VGLEWLSERTIVEHLICGRLRIERRIRVLVLGLRIGDHLLLKLVVVEKVDEGKEVDLAKRRGGVEAGIIKRSAAAPQLRKWPRLTAGTPASSVQIPVKSADVAIWARKP
jgi:hypothetical protein